MAKKSSVLLGKSIQSISKLRGGGSALPGLAIEKIDKSFLQDTLGKLPLGVVVVSGTNGKTTTVKIIKELLESQNIRVFTNSTGSNFKRGVISSVIKDIKLLGQLRADIAVLELDEAHAQHFIKDIKPKYSLLLNVMRDQMDRFGEIDKTARLLTEIAKQTTEAVVLNREDKRIANIANQTKSQVYYYGYAPELKQQFPGDDDLYSSEKNFTKDSAVAVLEKIDGQKLKIKINGESCQTTMRLSGSYNALNAVGAIALVNVILKENADNHKILNMLSNIEEAFGRGEIISVNGAELQIVLVKNPVSFKLALKSFADQSRKMIAINDNHADGRDMSWLWDVDFTPLSKDVEMVSGSRAYDMALRLKYDEIAVQKTEPNLSRALDEFIGSSSDQPMKIFCTYTAMLAIRKSLKKYAKVSKIL